MAVKLQNSCFSFARNIILAERTQLRILPLHEAGGTLAVILHQRKLKKSNQMGLLNLFGLKLETTNQNAQKITLEKDYAFMYEGFILSSQRKLYLLLEENKGVIDALTFEFLIYKFGYPNDEVGLPSKIPGVEVYGVSQVTNSEWIKELMINNRSHSRHSDSHYANYKHYIVRFKDVTLEVISKNYTVEKMTIEEFNEIVETERSYIKNDG